MENENKTLNEEKAQKKPNIALIAGVICAVVIIVVACIFVFNGDNEGGILNPDNLGELFTPEEPEGEEKCSQMLLNVLNDEYYNNLVARALNNTDLFESAEFDPHPYAFLEDEGFDVEKIKSGEMACYSMSYVLDEEPNNLYMQTRVLVNNSYYHTYLLKYTLTKQEMADYRLMHGDNNQDRYYTKAVFLNNEISEMKTPEIIGTSKFYKEDIDSMLKGYPNHWEFEKPSKYFEVIALEPSKDNTVKLVLYPYLKKNNMFIENSSVVIGHYLTMSILLFDNEICRTTPGIYEPITEEKKSADVFFSDTGIYISNGLLEDPYKK